MSALFMVSCAATGAFVGSGLGACSRRLITSAPSAARMVGLAASPLTALAFGGLAWRFGYWFDLLPYCVVAALGIVLGLIDVIERRLPSVLIYTGIALVGVELTTSAVVQARGPDLLRAVGGMAVLVAFYLVLALGSGGGLGAGDVKLGGLLGLALGWLGWSALITATFLGWLAAAMAWVLLRLARREPRGSTLAMGPFLVLGVLFTVIVMPY